MYLYIANWLKTSCVLLVYFFFTVQLVAQPLSKQVDSIRQVVKYAVADTDRVNGLISLSKAYNCADSGDKMKAAKEALQIAKKIQWRNGMINANLALGRIYFNCIQDYATSYKYFQQVVSMAKTCRDTTNEAIGLLHIAQVYGIYNQYAHRIDCYRQVLSLKISPERRLGALSNIGDTYTAIGDYTIALVYYDSALQVLNALMTAEKKRGIILCLRLY